MHTIHKLSTVLLSLLMVGLLVSPFNAYASTLSGFYSDPAYWEYVSSGSSRYAVCFELTSPVNNVQSVALGYSRVGDASNGALAGLYYYDETRYIWTFNNSEKSTSDDPSGALKIRYSTTTTSFDLDPGQYCFPVSPNVSSNAFSGSATGTQEPTYICTHSNPFPSGFSCGNANTTFMGAVNYAVCDSSTTCDFETTEELTRLISNTPADGATLATSTSYTVGATGYVHPDDFVDDMYLDLRFAPYDTYSNSDNYIANGAIFDVTIPITTDGYFDLSTTTSSFFKTGTWEIRTQIKRPHQFFFGSLPVSFGPWGDITVGDDLETTFVLSTTTYFDGVRDQINESIESITSTSTTEALSACAPLSLSFNISNCFVVMFLGTPTAWTSVVDSFNTNIMSRVPFGYFYRLYTILSTPTASVEFPHLEYTFGSSSVAVLQGSTMVINPWTDTSVVDRVVSDQDGSTPWDIIDPYVKLLVGLGILYHVVSRIIALDFSESLESAYANRLTSKELDHINNPVRLDKSVPREYIAMNDLFRSRMKK